MNILCWNCRGTAAKGFIALIKEMRRNYDSSILFLLETHSSGVRAQNQAKKTGFSGRFIVDSRGQSGGIWCLWDENIWKVEIIESSNQFVHLRVSWKGQISWFSTIVYASPYYVRRQQLWRDLGQIAESMMEPWLVLGDFNVIASPI